MKVKPPFTQKIKNLQMKQILQKVNGLKTFLLVLFLSAFSIAGNSQTVTISINPGPVCRGDNFNVEISITGAAPTSNYNLSWNGFPMGDVLTDGAGTATASRNQASFVGAGDGTYNFVYTEAFGGLTSFNSITAFTINPRPSAPVFSSDFSGAYDGANHTGSVTVSPGETAVWYTLSSAGAVTSGRKNVGSETFYAGAKNDLTGCESSTRTSALATITPKALTVNVTANNKVYDGGDDATLTVASFVGVVGGDIVNIGGTVTADFNDKTVANGKAITLTGSYTKSGADEANYSITQPTGLTADITPKELTVTVTANNKVYDGNTDATLNSSLNGKVGADDVTLVTTGVTGTFASEDVANGINVTRNNNYSISGTDIGNYSLTQPSAAITADITPKELTVTVTANNKVYDGNTDATLNSSLNGKVGADDVTLVTTGVTGTFASEDVANGINVTRNNNYSISGTDIGNYSLTQPSAAITADITPKELTVTVTANNKVYDGNTDATLNSSLNGKVGADDVTLVTTGVTGTFASEDVANGINVTRNNNYSISGTDIGNYSLTQPSAAITANITPKALTLTAHNQEKCFNTVFSFAGTEFDLSGLVAGDVVNGATLTSAGSVIGATASLTPYAIIPSAATGADVGNYTITYVNGGLRVHGLPTASFTFNDASQCLNGNSFEITNTSTPGLGASSASYIWNAPLAIGLDPIGTNQTLTYTSIGNYSVNVQVTSNKGCITLSSFTNNVTVVEHPTANFTTTENSGNTANDFNICTGATVNFNGSSSNFGFGATSLTTYQWSRDNSPIIGAPNSAIYSPVVNAITNPDLFDYTLRVRDNQGCWSNDEPTWTADPNQEIFVYPFPVPSFTTPVVGTQGQYGVPANNGNGGQLLCHGKVVFGNTSTIPSGSIVRYVWMYGDGSANDTVFTADNVKHEFPVNYTMNWFDPGFPNTRRSITLVAKSDQGCITSVTNTKDIKNGPDAIIGLSDTTVQPLIGNSFLFHNASMNRHPSFIDSSLWNWGDGTTTTNTTFIPKVYAANGNFRVHLINYTGTGCTDTAYLDLTVGNPVSSSFTYTPNACGSTDVSFTNTSTAATSYSWNFGDGNSSTLANPTHTYAATGTYTVILTINGTTASAPQTVHVVAAPVVGAIVNGGPSACGKIYSFSNTSTGVNLSYAWTFSGGTGAVSTNSNASRSYSGANTETVDLIVSADGRCPVSATQLSFTSVAATANPVAVLTIGAASVPNSTSKSVNNASTNASLYYVSLDGAAFTPQVSFPYDITGLSDGLHTVRLVASNLDGTCKDTATASFTITSVPCAATANFDILPTSTQLLSGNNYTFFNTTQVNGFGWVAGNSWDFGDGTTASTAHVYGKTFAAPGTYVVTYTATLSPANCTSTITKNVTITAPTAATFTHVPNNCNDLNVSFTSTSTGATSYSWNFGDGNSSTSANPTHTYAANGSYSVVLTINGTVVSAPQTVHVASNPVVGVIENNGPSACGKVYSFTNVSSGVNLSYAWSFSGGTGSVSTSASANRVYSGIAAQTVDLIVTADGRCAVNATQISFNSEAGTTAPTAGVSIGAASLPSATSVSVNNTSTNANLYYVSLDGAAFTSETTFPYDITGLTNGSHTIRLVASDLTGTCKDTATVSFNITSTPCIALAGFNITPAASQPLSTNRFDFFNTTQHNGFGWVVSNAWDFGDGTTNTLNTHIYGKTYAAPGTYPVTLVATSSTGCSSTITHNVTVTASAVASFTYVPNTCGNKIVAFTSTAVSASSYLWNFGDGNTSTSANPSHTYAADGSYSVTLTINGSIVSAPQVVHVVSNPVAGVIGSTLNTCGNIYTYSVAGATGVNLTYTWNFTSGNGSGASTGSSVTRTYSADGPETVSLLVSADGRCNATAADLSLSVLEIGTPVSADLQVTASDACSGVRTINNAGSTGATSYEVSIDGGAYVIKNTFPYDITGLTPGNHTVSLKAINGLCSDIATETFVVGSLTAGFTSSSSSCGPTVTFTNTTTSTFGTPSYAWNFNAGESTSILVSPSYTFGSAGTKTVSLVATLPNGCSSTSTNTGIVANAGSGVPSASFTTEMIVNGSCNTGIKFTSTSTGATTYVWTYGDGTVSVPSTTTTIFHAYAATGTFAVTLTASGACGQSSSHTANVVVTATGYPTPEVSFSTDVATQCITGNRFDFFNRTQLNGWGWVPTYRWYFGDGTTDFVNSYAYGKTYASPGTYTVKLVGVSNFGCADSSTMQVVVLAPGACTPGKMREAIDGKNTSLDASISKFDNGANTTGLTISTDISNDLVLYPNPNNGSFKLTFKDLSSDEFVVSIVDMLGRQVYLNNVDFKGSKEMNLTDLDLAPGSYNIILNGSNDVFARKSFVVIK